MDPFNDPSFQQQPAASWPYDLMQQYQPVQQASPHQQDQAPPQFITPMSYMQQASSQPFTAPQAPSINIPENLGPDFIPLGLFSQLQGQVLPQPTQQPAQPALDANGQPIKVRKKPGRKPNPASPALRKAQNRAAQRAFRERKERHLRDLENTIRTLREQRANAVKELNEVKAKLDSYKAENWYLKGVVLTLQFVCLHHNIQIPNHSPYLTEEALSEMARTSPHAIEAYVNAYTRNNIDLKPTMASQFANLTRNAKGENTSGGDDLDEDLIGHFSSSDREKSSEPRHTSPGGQSRGESVDTMSAMESMEGTTSTHQDETIAVKQEDTDEDMLHKHNTEKSSNEPSMSSLGAIQRIRLQLRIQSTLTSFGNSNVRLQPTLLQLAIPHDPRIDLIPTAHMRDRMIIFRDFMDYDRCFSMLLNGAVYHGGDPTLSESWELPAEFFAEFWYLAINYDYKRTNKWRLMKGLPKIESAVKEAGDNSTRTTTEEQGSANNKEQCNNNNNNNNKNNMSNNDNSNNDNNNGSDWSDDAFSQFIETMPSLQPVQSITSPASQNSASDSMTHPLYERFLSSPPELREPIRSPSLGNIMDLMTSLSTDHKKQQE